MALECGGGVKPASMKEGDGLAESKLDEILRTRQAPGIAGAGRGPGCGNSEMVFDRPNPLHDGLRTARIMEEGGKLKDPRIVRLIQNKMRSLKAQEPLREKVDYQKEGHPIERNDTDE